MYAVSTNHLYLNTRGLPQDLENTQAVYENRHYMSLLGHAMPEMKDSEKAKLRLKGRMDVEDPARAKKTFVLRFIFMFVVKGMMGCILLSIDKMFSIK